MSDYAQVANCDLLKSPNTMVEAISEDGCPSSVDAANYTTETIKGKRFVRSRWSVEEGQPIITSDVTIGMTADVQGIMGMQVEAWEDMEIVVEESQSRIKELCLMLENSKIETQYYTSMNLWSRIKWALSLR